MTNANARISVVFQGPLARDFTKLAANTTFLREHLPEIELIFSGWKGELTPEQKKTLGGKIVEMEDPGPNYLDPITGVQHNVERQEASTCAGIKAATGTHVAKMRSDVMISNLNFFQNLEDDTIRVLDIGTMDPAKIPYLFHASDMAQIGPREAMLDLWNFTGDYETHRPLSDILRGKLLLGQTGMRCTKHSVEQEIILNWMQRKGHDVHLRWIDENTFDLALLSEQFIAKHFKVMPYTKTGLTLPPHIVFGFRDWYYNQETLDKISTLTTPQAYQERYNKIRYNKLRTCVTRDLFIKGILLIVLYPLIMLVKSIFPAWLTITKRKPKELNMSPQEMRIYMSSFDDYNDLWPPFFKAFFHFWPDCPFPVSLGACEKAYSDDRIKTLHAYPHKNWSSRALEHLAQMEESYVLMTLDDFILRSPVRTETITSVLKQMKILNLLAVRLYAEPGPQIAINGYPMLGIMGVGQQNRTSTHATIWHRETLISVIREGESLWEFEINAALRTLQFAHQIGGTWKTVMDYHMGVAKGRWLYTPAKVLMNQGFLDNPPPRPVMTRKEEIRATCLLVLNKTAQRLTPLRWRQWLRSTFFSDKYNFSE